MFEKSPGQNDFMTLSLYYKYIIIIAYIQYSKTSVKRPLSKRPQIGFQDKLSLNAGQMYCRMLQREHSVICSTFIKLPFVIKLLSILICLFWVAILHRFYFIHNDMCLVHSEIRNFNVMA